MLLYGCIIICDTILMKLFYYSGLEENRNIGYNLEDL